MKSGSKQILTGLMVLLFIFCSRVSAFCAEVLHRYKLQNVAVWSPDYPAPYGHVINYVWNETDQKWEKLYQKFVTADGKHWGHWSEGKTKGDKYYAWYTAPFPSYRNHLREIVDPTKQAEADITVYYDATKVVDGKTGETRKTSYDGQTAFVDIEAFAEGGALCNNDEISIAADFLRNYALNAEGGGAIYNNKKIMSLTGDFLANCTGASNACGGAIYNNSIIESITGDFLGNYAVTSGDTAYGGAIYNNDATIKEITGDFLGNYVRASGDAAYGGAIYNNHMIESITGDFLGNYAVTSGGTACGGAIYNNHMIKSITGDFLGNYVQASGGAAYGGAIYNYITITITTRQGDVARNIAFSGNYVSASNPTMALGGAIYNERRGTINLYAEQGHSITFVGSEGDEKVDSVHNEGTININGTEETITSYTGTVNFATITGDGTMNIYGGVANMKGAVTQDKITNDGILSLFDTSVINTIAGSGTVNNSGFFKGNFVKENEKTPVFNNKGTWYIGDTSTTQDVEAILSDGGAIDIAYTGFENDASGKPDYTKQKYEAKDNFVNVTVSNLTINEEGMLKIRSKLAAKDSNEESSADKLIASALNLLGEDKTLKIQVMWDPCFNQTDAFEGKPVNVFTATDLSGLTVAPIATYTANNGMFTPIFETNSTGIILKGFSYTAPTPSTTSEALGELGKSKNTTEFTMIGDETLTEDWGEFLERADGTKNLTLNGGTGNYTVDGNGKNGLTVKDGFNLTVDSIKVTNMKDPFSNAGNLTLSGVTVDDSNSGVIRNDGTLNIENNTTFSLNVTDAAGTGAAGTLNFNTDFTMSDNQTIKQNTLGVNNATFSAKELSVPNLNLNGATLKGDVTAKLVKFVQNKNTIVNNSLTANEILFEGGGSITSDQPMVVADIVALGKGATIGANNSVALGANSVADEENTVSVGRSAGSSLANGQVALYRRVTNVAMPLNANDAANKAYVDSGFSKLNSDMNRLDERTRQVGAHAAALSALHPLPYDPNAPTSFSAGVGTYRDETSYAIGVFHYTSDRFMFNLGASVTKGADVMGRAGISFSLGKGAKNAKSAKLEKAQMQEMLAQQQQAYENRFQQQVAKLEQENNAIRQENSEIKKANEEIRKKYNAIEKANAQNQKLILELLKRTAKRNGRTLKSNKKATNANTKKKTKK